MPINKTGETRDLVIELATRFEELERRVSKNSEILDRLDGYVTQAKGAGRLTRALWAGGQMVFAGGAGAGLMTWAQAHLPKLALALALLVPTSSARAEGLEGWILEIRACRGEDCRTATRDLGGSWRCEAALERLNAYVPGSKPATWGFLEEGPPVTVRGRCITAEGA